MRGRGVRLAAGASLLAAAAAAACFSERVAATGDDCVAPADSTVGGSPVVRIVDFSFQPSSACVTAGSTVTWRNDGAQLHSTVADGGGWSSPLLSTGGTFTATLTAVGTHTYVCSVHPAMQARVVVR